MKCVLSTENKHAIIMVIGSKIKMYLDPGYRINTVDLFQSID